MTQFSESDRRAIICPDSSSPTISNIWTKKLPLGKSPDEEKIGTKPLVFVVVVVVVAVVVVVVVVEDDGPGRGLAKTSSSSNAWTMLSTCGLFLPTWRDLKIHIQYCLPNFVNNPVFDITK